MDINWRNIIAGPVGGYYFTGDVNPFEYGGCWINPDTFHAVRLEGLDAGITDTRDRPVCLVESLEVICHAGCIRESLRCVGLPVSDWLRLPRLERRLRLADALLAYGHYDPSNEYPNHHVVETRRESAAFRAVNNFMR